MDTIAKYWKLAEYKTQILEKLKRFVKARLDGPLLKQAITRQFIANPEGPALISITAEKYRWLLEKHVREIVQEMDEESLHEVLKRVDDAICLEVKTILSKENLKCYVFEDEEIKRERILREIQNITAMDKIHRKYVEELESE